MDTPSDHEGPKNEGPPVRIQVAKRPQLPGELVRGDMPPGALVPPPPPMSIWGRMTNVTSQIERLKKEGFNQGQGYKFVKIEDVVDALRPLLAQQGLFLQWDTVGYELIETKTSKGYPAWLCKLVTRLTIYDEAGDLLDCGQTFAMAIDSGDKAVTKAETSARKYSLIKAFNLSTGDDLENDNEDDKKPATKPKAAKQQRLVPGPDRKVGIARLMVTLNKLAKYDPERAEKLLDDPERPGDPGWRRHEWLDDNFGVRSLNDLSDNQFHDLLTTVEKALSKYE